MAAAEKIPVERFEVAGIENEAMAFRDWAIVKRFGAHDGEQLVGAGARFGKSFREGEGALSCEGGCHFATRTIGCRETDSGSG